MLAICVQDIIDTFSLSGLIKKLCSLVRALLKHCLFKLCMRVSIEVGERGGAFVLMRKIKYQPSYFECIDYIVM